MTPTSRKVVVLFCIEYTPTKPIAFAKNKSIATILSSMEGPIASLTQIINKDNPIKIIETSVAK